MHLRGKKVLLCITGSIAAYKSILLLRLLVKNGAEVKVIMTDSAGDFVSPLVLSTLSKNPVLIGLSDKDGWANHVMLGRWADLMVVAPLSCNTLAKMANGLCDNLLTAVYLSATCAVLVCPAMDEDMWLHKSTQRNLLRLKEDGVQVMPVGFGELGSGLVGEGRMAEPELIFNRVSSFLAYPGKPLLGKAAIVTAGPTYEPIDPVRFIGNHSSGRMGIAIADELALAGAKVQLILGPSSRLPVQEMEIIKVNSAAEMFDATVSRFNNAEIGVFAAAVADFRPKLVYDEKLKKNPGFTPPAIELTENPDILKHCGLHKHEGQTVVGFALETENEEANALKKLETKRASMIVLNSLKDEGVGFGAKTNKVTIFNEDGRRQELPLQLKEEIAVHIVQAIIKQIHT